MLTIPDDKRLGWDFECLGIYKDGCLVVEGQEIEVEWVFQAHDFHEDDGDTIYLLGLCTDGAGNYFGVRGRHLGLAHGGQHEITKLTEKEALRWFAENVPWNDCFRGALVAAVEGGSHV